MPKKRNGRKDEWAEVRAAIKALVSENRRRTEEDRRRAEEDRRRAEEDRRRAEERKEEERRRAEERKEEERRRAEERKEEERRRAEENRLREERAEREWEVVRHQVGKISSAVGYFAEGLVGPSLPRLLKSMGIRVTHWSYNAESHRNGESREIDLLAVGVRESDDAPVVAAVEVANQLTAGEVKNCLAKLPDFFDYFPEFRSHELIAGVAGMKVRPDAARHAERQGLIVLGPGEEFAQRLNSPGFVPKVWRAGP